MNLRIVCVGIAIGAACFALPRPASACGGCFHPITGTPTVVTRHQMVVALSARETTLWDQIEYAGNPEDFAWVLPVRDGAPVELADNAFFEALEQQGTITLQAPPSPRLVCPDPCGGGVFFGDGAPSAADAGVVVTVHHEASIGPYETATIGSTDPDALVAWLRANGYAVPDSMLPTIRHYTDQGMDFAVLRLSPNAGVNQMQPVRVSSPGLVPTFPLRMVAAGVGDSVGLELYVLAEGRYQPMNFASVEVDRAAVTYDWATNTFDYETAYAAAAASNGGRAWVTEVARLVDGWAIESYSSFDPVTGRRMGTAAVDWAVVTRHLDQPYLTRLTADLAVEHLGEDLVLGASSGGDLSSLIVVDHELNRPEEPVCSTVCADPYGSGSAGGLRGAGRGDGLCGVRPGPASGLGFFAFFAASVLLMWRRR